MPLQLQSAAGLLLLLVVAWSFSANRRTVRWRIVLSGVGLQVLMAVLLLHAPGFHQFFVVLNEALLALQKATAAGTSFVFGYLGGGELPFDPIPGRSSFVLAFHALPLMLVVSALSALLFHWGILPVVVKGVSRVLERTMGVGGAVGLSTAANVFVGMVEAPLVIRPYLRQLDRGELFMVMTAGMAGVAGTVMVLYGAMLGAIVPDALGHILSASLISAPAAIVIAALMVPPGDTATVGNLETVIQTDGAMDAITRGTLQGLELLLGIVAMLVVLIALVTLVNLGLGLLPPVAGGPVTLQRIAGIVMIPLVWMAGVPAGEAWTAGTLMGTKTVLNEFIAYADMAALPAGALSERSRLVMTYALCGFANFGSLGIMIGGMGSMVPERREEIVRLGMRSIISGTLATLTTGATIGMLTP